MRQALAVCPSRVSNAVAKECENPKVQIEELRMRVGAPVTILSRGREWALSENGRPIMTDTAMVRGIVSNAVEHSLYAAQEKIKEGFCTLPGGHRLGICGSIVRYQGEIQSMKEFSSLNLRIARQLKGSADELSRTVWQHPESTLIFGPPGCGKTTLLRDLIRQLSDRYRFRISVIDERGEIAACLDGAPQFQIGACTDVLSACSKEEGIYILLRAMRPEWIAVDEISACGDVDAILRACYSGVRFAATAHAWDRADLEKRQVYRELLQTGVFHNLAFLDRERKLHCERI